MWRPSRRLLFAARACAAAALGSAWAHAGGYDTPMLYSARHMGMGGTAIGYVRDPSALFHNPSGLAHVEHGAALGDFSLLVGGIHGSPSATGIDLDSDTTIAPFFLVGGAYRVNHWLVLGVGVYPVASAGATYYYARPGFEDRTKLFFVEVSPGLGFNLPEHVRLGLGYRVTYARLERFKGASGETPSIDFDLSGVHLLGLRLGAQWTALPWLELGLVYRHRTTTKVTNDRAIALSHGYSDAFTNLVLPSKWGIGSRVDLESFGAPLRIAVDAEYTQNSQNGVDALHGIPDPDPSGPSYPTEVSNVFDWSNSVTLRGGVEYGLFSAGEEHAHPLVLRAGYVYDGVTANKQYPSAFGTPPAPTQVLTVGLGTRAGKLQSNVAYAYRFGSGRVTPQDLSAPGRMTCVFCGDEGEYRIHLNGVYVDFGYDF